MASLQSCVQAVNEDVEEHRARVEPCGTPITAVFGVSCVPMSHLPTPHTTLSLSWMKTSCPSCPSEPQGCDSRAATTQSPPSTAWPRHPGAAQSLRVKPTPHPGVFIALFTTSPCWAFKRCYLQRKHGHYFLEKPLGIAKPWLGRTHSSNALSAMKINRFRLVPCGSA